MERTVSSSSRILRSSHHLENNEFLALNDQNNKIHKKNKKESLKNKNKMEEALEAPYIDYEIENLESDNSSIPTNPSEEFKECEKDNNSVTSNSSMKESIITHNDRIYSKNAIKI